MSGRTGSAEAEALLSQGVGGRGKSLAGLPEGARVLVIRLRSMGDTVLMTPALRLLHDWRPDLRVSVLSEERTRPVKFMLAPGMLKLTAYSPDFGEAEEQVEVQYTGEEITDSLRCARWFQTHRLGRERGHRCRSSSEDSAYKPSERSEQRRSCRLRTGSGPSCRTNCWSAAPLESHQGTARSQDQTRLRDQFSVPI